MHCVLCKYSRTEEGHDALFVSLQLRVRHVLPTCTHINLCTHLACISVLYRVLFSVIKGFFGKIECSCRI